MATPVTSALPLIRVEAEASAATILQLVYDIQTALQILPAVGLCFLRRKICGNQSRRCGFQYICQFHYHPHFAKCFPTEKATLRPLFILENPWVWRSTLYPTVSRTILTLRLRCFVINYSIGSIIAACIAIKSSCRFASSCAVTCSVCYSCAQGTTCIAAPIIIQFITNPIAQSCACCGRYSRIYVCHEITTARSASGYLSSNCGCTSCSYEFILQYLNYIHYLHPRF